MKMEQTKPHAKKALAFLAIIVSLLAACLLAGCSSSNSQEKVELEIYAANSLTDAMNEAQEAYTKENPNVTFKDSQYEASGTLVQKIEAGGAPDIFISANKKNMDKVVEDGKIGEDKPFDLFANDLVIVTAEDSDIDELDLAQACDGSYTISVGDKNVPAGTYAKQALYTVGCYTNESGTDGEITGRSRERSPKPIRSVRSARMLSLVKSIWLRLQFRCYALRWREDRLHPAS